MGFKKGSQNALIDNEIRRINKQAIAYSKLGGTDTKVYEGFVFHLTRLYGFENIKWNKDGVVQIKRSNKLIDKLKTEQGSKILAESHRIKTAGQRKSEMMNIIKKNLPELMKKTNKTQRDEVVKTMFGISDNNIGVVLEKYFKKEVDGGNDSEDYSNDVGSLKNGRETRALITGEYLRKYKPAFPNDLSSHEVINKETGEITTAEIAYKQIEDEFNNYASNKEMGLIT